MDYETGRMLDEIRSRLDYLITLLTEDEEDKDEEIEDGREEKEYSQKNH